MDDAQAPAPRSMENMPVVDFSGIRDRDRVAGLRLKNIGAILVPQDLPDLMAATHCENVGAIIPVSTDTRVESRIGNLELAGDALAAGDDQTILLLVGQVVVTPEVTRVGYRGLVLIGSTFLPRSAQSALTGKIVSQAGEVLYYDGGNPRVFMDDVRVTKGFLELVKAPLALILVGDASFAGDVTPELLAQKVGSITAGGDVSVENPDLLPMVQYLAKSVSGSIQVAAPGAAGAS